LRPDNNHSIIRFLTLLAAAAVLAGCATEPLVDVYLVSIKPAPSTLFEQRAELNLRFQNLQASPLKASGVDLKLLVNDRQIARGVDNKSFTIPALADATTTVVVSSSVFATIRQLLAMQGAQTFSYGLKGRLHTNGSNRRFEKSGEIGRSSVALLAPQAN
jgi:LEA14-like dessication related protein